MIEISPALIIFLTIFVVIIINFAIVVSVRNRKPTKSNSGKLIKRAFKQVRNPFQNEENDLNKLSELVDKLKEEKKSDI